MYKDSVNSRNVAITHYGAPYHHIFQSTGSVSQASARRQVRKRQSLLEVIGNALACLLIIAIVDIALINFFAFPDCNRVTRDCFLVENLWGAK